MAGSSSSTRRLQTILDDAWQGATGFHFSGRVTKIRRSPGAASSRLGSLYRNSRMLATAGAHESVTWSVGPHTWTTRTDHRGYWSLSGFPSLSLAPGWHELTANPTASSPAGLMVCDPRNAVGLISDLDDTILVTGVSSRRSFLRNSLMVPPEKRLAVPQMAAAYTRLVQTLPHPASAPVFYLSATPRQLTDNVRTFLSQAGYPRGVLLLKEVSRDSSDAIREHGAYKSRRIAAILASYPDVRFHFFGDDGDRDPETYVRLRDEFPRQVAGIWIHRVSPKRRALPEGVREVTELPS